MSGVRPKLGTAVLWNVGVAVAYFGCAILGLLDQLLQGHLSPFWPASGLALAALLLLGWRVWPGIVIGTILVGLVSGLSLPGVLGTAAGNTLGVVLAYHVLRKADFCVEINRLRDALALVFPAALGAMAVGANVGASVLVLTHEGPNQSYGVAWLVWWVANVTGVLVATPLALLLRKGTQRRTPIRLARVVEATLLMVGTSLVAVLGTQTTFDVIFLVFPFLFWAVWRFQLAGAAPCVLIASIVVTYAAEAGSGPFADMNVFAALITLQAFASSAALTGLLLAALVAERNHTYQEIERACVRLADVMSLRDRAVHHAENWRTGSREHEPSS